MHQHRYIPYHTVWYGFHVPTRSDWLQAGLAAVVVDGPNGLRIDRLCRRVGVSKGSLPPSLRGRQTSNGHSSPLAKILLSRHSTRRLIRRRPQRRRPLWPASPLPSPAPASTELEVAMRAWAFSDAEVRAVQERVDSQRLESLRHLVEDPR